MIVTSGAQPGSRGAPDPDETKRLALWRKQQGLCDCCAKPMWEPKEETSAQFIRRLYRGETIRDEAQPSTAEHDCANGEAPPAEENSEDDVATCEVCSSYLGSLDYATFKAKVRSGVSPRSAAHRLRGW